MNLEELVRKGTIDDGFEEKTVQWDSGDETLEFQVFVKREMSAADYEYIFLNTAQLGREEDDSDGSFMARRVHRMVRMQDHAAIPYNTAKRFKQSLLMALCSALNEVERSPVDENDEEDDEGKT
ncbi:hypothetical protein [Kushneria phosphatilytica]|uniref:Uncharacterized protein n=1 Tax=Kushneria phosphatilytica TaxID=657387 RepID=A0A1S1NXC3_9GAMM|nr:hypothetical protein [Kushneria phosphatilytica]OHV12118.1 hypothetical protein BH688_05555 [Kushneria phosphatilytica]QEL11312.1 hypothetical protein FY550_09300 [Kushneria phosphatilytica]